MVFRNHTVTYRLLVHLIAEGICVPVIRPESNSNAGGRGTGRRMSDSQQG